MSRAINRISSINKSNLVIG